MLGGEYLLEAFMELGLYDNHPMGGELPLGWLTLDAYARVTGTLVESWEFNTLRQMSIAYIEGKRAGESVLAVAPIDQEEETDG